MMGFSARYKELIGRCASLFLVGTALQLFIGEVKVPFLTYPWSIILAVNYLYVLILLYAYADKLTFVKRWYDRPASLVSLLSMLVMTLLFGLIRQDDSPEGWTGILGFSKMNTSWIFVLFLLHFMTVMGLKAIDDVHHWKKRKFPVVVMHVSFFVILASAVFGSGEKIRMHVTAYQGRPVNRGMTADGHQVDLPFTIRLQKFSLDAYPPRIYAVTQGRLSKEYVVIEGKGSRGQLGSCQLECLDYLEKAGCMSEDSAYVAMNHVGATTAVYLKATSVDGNHSAEGWVSDGSFLFAGRSLQLPDGVEWVMPQREVKKYLSKIEIWEGEEKTTFDIAVNHPAAVGSWKIYQSGYDYEKGRWSTTSILECVKDGWYPVIHLSMWLILAGGVLMLILGHQKKKEGKE